MSFLYTFSVIVHKKFCGNFFNVYIDINYAYLNILENDL